MRPVLCLLSILCAFGLASRPRACPPSKNDGDPAAQSRPSLVPAWAELAGQHAGAAALRAQAAALRSGSSSRPGNAPATPVPPEPLCVVGATGDTTVLRAHGLTDMGAVVQLLMQLETLDGSATDLWKGGLDWMVAHALPGNPGYKWAWIENDPQWGDSYLHPIAALNALAFAEGWTRTQNPCYLQMAAGAMDWLEAEQMALASLPGGAGLAGCAYVELDLWETPHLYNIGSYGHAAIARSALEVYRLTGDATARSIAECLAETYRSVAETDSASGGKKWGVFMPVLTGYHYVSFCAGTAGIVEFLIEMARTFPGSWYEQYARDGLTWLGAIAVPEPSMPLQPAYKWPTRTDLPDSLQLYQEIVGGGAAGVGRAFLAGYATWGDPRYLRFARGGGNWILGMALPAAGHGIKWGGAGWWENWCVGQIGIMNFLGRLHDVTQALEYRLGFEDALDWLEGQLVSAGTGGAIFPNSEGGNSTSTDFIWGFTGLANEFYDPMCSLVAAHPELYVLVLEFLDGIKVAENGGYAWPWPVSVAMTDAGDDAVAARAAAWRPRALPNPSRAEVTIETPLGGPKFAGAATVEASGNFELRIVDVTGRLVRRIQGGGAGTSAGASLRWRWDARDDSGRRVPRGLYFATLRGPGVDAARAPAVRFVVLR
jgi:hypothetical protein